MKQSQCGERGGSESALIWNHNNNFGKVTHLEAETLTRHD